MNVADVRPASDTPRITAARRRYEASADAGSWLVSHHWQYGEDVALATARDVRTKLQLRPTDEIVEIGAGTGGFLAAVMHADQRGVGFDLCPPLVRRARLERGQQISVGAAEAAWLPFRDESFDRVLCYSVTQYFPDHAYAARVVRELVRVCRIGGVVLLGDVCGFLERPRKQMLRLGLPNALVEAFVTAMMPARAIVRLRPFKKKNPVEYFRYRRCFFARALAGYGCKVETLDQEIPGRDVSSTRYDVRIFKLGPSR